MTKVHQTLMLLRSAATAGVLIDVVIDINLCRLKVSTKQAKESVTPGNTLDKVLVTLETKWTK